MYKVEIPKIRRRLSRNKSISTENNIFRRLIEHNAPRVCACSSICIYTLKHVYIMWTSNNKQLYEYNDFGFIVTSLSSHQFNKLNLKILQCTTLYSNTIRVRTKNVKSHLKWAEMTVSFAFIRVKNWHRIKMTNDSKRSNVFSSFERWYNSGSILLISIYVISNNRTEREKYCA